MIGWIGLGAILGWGMVRIFWGYPEPDRRLRVLTRREAALLSAAADATFPAGGSIAISGSEAGLAAYTDRWLAALPARTRLLMRCLFFLVEHATLFRPARGRGGFRRFTSLAPHQQQAVLDGWRTSGLAGGRLVFASLRAILAMGFFACPAVQRQLGVAPLAIESPVTEADLLYAPIGRTPDAIPWTRDDLTPPGPRPPLDLAGPLHPDFAEEGT